VEHKAYDYRLTRKILTKIKYNEIIEINDYKNVFSKNNQNFQIQKNSPNIIFAVKKENYIYKGAKVCESFGNNNFYYTSSVINCIYNCEYCYLQGMYTSANIVIFVNIEDTFSEITNFLKNDSMYLCISYDTDMLGLNNITGFVDKWYKFAEKNKNLTIELRTKSDNIAGLRNRIINKNFILAWTLSPENFIKEHELLTAKLENRLKAIKEVVNLGYSVRICFDPIIYMKNFEVEYKNLIEQTFSYIKNSDILDVSIGTFRISKEYLKKMRKHMENSSILMYPFTCIDGVYSYSEEQNLYMMNYVKGCVLEYVEGDKIYV
jgi:spore photoproduct lyase